MRFCNAMILVLSIGLLSSSSGLAQSLVAAVPPSSRFVEVGTSATAFATITEAGRRSDSDCGPP